MISSTGKTWESNAFLMTWLQLTSPFTRVSAWVSYSSWSIAWSWNVVKPWRPGMGHSRVWQGQTVFQSELSQLLSCHSKNDHLQRTFWEHQAVMAAGGWVDCRWVHWAGTWLLNELNQASAVFLNWSDWKMNHCESATWKALTCLLVEHWLVHLLVFINGHYCLLNT